MILNIMQIKLSLPHKKTRPMSKCDQIYFSQKSVLHWYLSFHTIIRNIKTKKLILLNVLNAVPRKKKKENFLANTSTKYFWAYISYYCIYLWLYCGLIPLCMLGKHSTFELYFWFNKFLPVCFYYLHFSNWNVLQGSLCSVLLNLLFVWLTKDPKWILQSLKQIFQVYNLFDRLFYLLCINN